MKVETKNDVTENEWSHLTRWREHVFPEEGLGMEWTPVSWHAIAYSEAGVPVGHIGFDRFKILVDSTERDVIGVGGVVVRPEHQGQGIPALLFREVHREARERFDSDLFTLFCPSRLISYYRKRGYQQHQGPVHFLQHGVKVASSFEFMHRGGITPTSSIELQGAPW